MQILIKKKIYIYFHLPIDFYIKIVLSLHNEMREILIALELQTLITYFI